MMDRREANLALLPVAPMATMLAAGNGGHAPDTARFPAGPIRIVVHAAADAASDMAAWLRAAIGREMAGRSRFQRGQA